MFYVSCRLEGYEGLVLDFVLAPVVEILHKDLVMAI